jgi:hypothetical protein
MPCLDYCRFERFSKVFCFALFLSAVLLVLPQHANAQTVLPLETKGGLLLVGTKVNSKTLTLILDTAAAASLLVTKGPGLLTVDELNLLNNKVHLNGTGGNGSEIPVARVDIKFVGKILRVDVGVVASLPPGAPECDGLLGNDVLGQFQKITIDRQGKRLILE